MKPTICFLFLLGLVFVPGSTNAQPATGLHFYPVTPCRILDTRDVLQGPPLQAGVQRNVPMETTPLTCGLPNNMTGAVAYSINITVVPRAAHMNVLVAWGTGTPIPLVSTMNDPMGIVMANHAIVQGIASQSYALSFLATDDTDLIVDVDGYFN